MDLEECNQITDLTLAHLATGCPSLEKLVNTHSFNIKIGLLNIDRTVFFSFLTLNINSDAVTLRTHYRRWDPAIGCRKLRCREFVGAGIGQLSADYRPNARAFSVLS